MLLDAAKEYLVPTDYPGWKAGDVLVFRVKHSLSAKHCAIAINEYNMIHAVSRRGVIITGIGDWSKRIAGVFSFPGVK
jgi:cell wall-associated NlpC family hydrolase